MEFRNYTTHEIVLNDGTRFPSVGLARVEVSFGDFDANGVCHQQFGDVTGLPPYDVTGGVCYIVSGMVAGATDRADVVAPATDHPDTIRNEKWHIVSVPGFVR